jgi:predicted phosphodiesterase
MNSDQRLAILADIHGEHRTLAGILRHCKKKHVDRVVLLGDLFDRVEQIESCVRELHGWPVTGVLGNHERDALHGYVERAAEIAHLIRGTGDSLHLYEAVFLHDQLDRGLANGSRVIFAGHTHVRQAVDDRGPLDLSLGHITLLENRRYLINPGAVVDGQFAIWDRKQSKVLFERV